MTDDPTPSRPRNEVKGAAGVASEAVDIVSRPVQGTHGAVADTVFGALRRVGLGPVSRPVQIAHDGISAGVYATVRGIGHLAGRGVGAAAVLARGDDWRPITSRSTGAVVTGAVNGLVGDHMVALRNDLAVPMTLYTPSLTRGLVELPLDPDALRDAVDDHPDRHLDHVVLFVHGLGETEHAWRVHDDESGGEGYAERVSSTLGAAPLLLRYNSGLPLAHNGAALSVLLSEVVERWPVPIRRLDLVGHSMGGLVLRHACHAAVASGAPTRASGATGENDRASGATGENDRASGATGENDRASGATGDSWVSVVRRMVYLGSPHRGAPLAHRVDQLAERLQRYSRSRTWGEFLDRRSAGIRDLVAGVSDTEVPLLAHASHHAVAACLTASEHHPLANALGDLLVPVDSARGAITDVEPLASSHHFHLLNDPDVHDHLLRWLAPSDDLGTDRDARAREQRPPGGAD